MTQNIKYSVISGILLGIAGLSPFRAEAQKFALKPYVDIGIGNPMSVKSDLELSKKSGNNNSFGLDFGYTFLHKGGNSLEANLGIGYSITNLNVGLTSLEYNYMAPPTADVDNNPYIRYYELSGLEQKINVGYFTVPVYLSYGYQFSSRVGLHADLGFRFGFKCASKLSSMSGSAYCYGIYPEFDNLEITLPGLNDFGTTDLSEAKRGKVEANGFYTSLLVGLSFDVYLFGPVWLNVGARYDCGFTNTFKKIYEPTNFTSESAPVTYTVANNQEVKPLSSYLSSSKLSPFSIHAGLTFKF